MEPMWADLFYQVSKGRPESFAFLGRMPTRQFYSLLGAARRAHATKK